MPPNSFFSNLAIVIVQVIKRSRPFSLLATYTTPEAYEKVLDFSKNESLKSREIIVAPYIPKRVSVIKLSGSAVEANVSIKDGDKVRIVAMRCVFKHGRWRIVDLSFL
jgi:ribosomal protein S17